MLCVTSLIEGRGAAASLRPPLKNRTAKRRAGNRRGPRRRKADASLLYVASTFVILGGDLFRENAALRPPDALEV